MGAAKTDPKNIPWFNPREMDDATLTALATGRERLIADFLETVDRRLHGIADGQTGGHWLVTGTRGAGKSYFLRYAQIRTSQRFAAERVRFVLLPEELRNIRAPHDLLDEIRRMLIVEQGDPGRPAQWRSEAPEQLWQEALQRLLSATPAQLLVVGIENFADVLKRGFSGDVAASLLRKLMEHEPRVLLLGSAVDGSFDEDYGQRLFLQFSKRPLPVWDGQAHRTYLTQRAALLQRKPSSRQLARIDAYSRYTGGNARIAAILAAAILEEQDITQAGADLNATLDKMSDYYRDLLDTMPPNSETLFDALVRGGEPCSQTELAKRVGAHQNDISRAFRWLLDGGYLLAQRPKGQKETLYQVADRLFVQWYRMRYLNPGQLSRLAVLAELLADTLEFGEKWRYALHFAEAGERHDALLMAELGFKACGIDMGKLQAEGAQIDTLLQWGERLMNMPIGIRGEDIWTRQMALLEEFPSDESMQKEFCTARKLADSCHPYPDILDGSELADLCTGSLSLHPTEKLNVIRQLPRLSKTQWTALEETFRDELTEFEKLISTERDIINGFRNKSELGKRYPWIMTWTDFPRKYDRDDCVQDEVNFLRGVSSAIFCLYATQKQTVDEGQLLSAWQRLFEESDKLYTYPEGLDFISQLLAASRGVFPPERRSRFLCQSAHLNSLHGQYDISLALAKEARTCLEAAPVTPENVRWLIEAWERTGWVQGQRFEWTAAFASHQAALTLRLEHKSRNLAWGIGQLARYRWHMEGLAAAWRLIEGQPLDTERTRMLAIRQLGDAVVDVQRQSGPQAAYAKARELFAFLGKQDKVSLPSALRALFIDMVGEGLALPTLHDLAQDLANLYPDSPHAKEIATLARTLEGWIVALQKVQEEGSSTQPGANTDPDWQLTLKALNEALPLNSRVRLGLTSPPQLGKAAAALFKRMLTFVRTPKSEPPETV